MAPPTEVSKRKVSHTAIQTFEFGTSATIFGEKKCSNRIPSDPGDPDIRIRFNMSADI